ncbi:MAG: PD-(D/E)XK nuclease family protein [Patescibacteria group bacterium]|nr:PD-(D/E)XK nuclease family protein [Patescibacteria group bacterium]
MFEISPYTFRMFSDCPQQYFFYNQKDLKNKYRKSRPYFVAGSIVHSTLKNFFSCYQPGERDQETLLGLFKTEWARNLLNFQKSGGDEQLYFQRMRDQLLLFAEKQDLRAEPALTEDYYEAFLDEETLLKGKIDRADKINGKTIVIDYKTNKTIPENQDPLQLYAYAYILNEDAKLKLKLEGEFKVSQASYLYLSASDLYTFEVDEEILEKTRQMFLEKVKEIKKTENEYSRTGTEARVGKHCHFCDFVEICPRKAEAAGFAKSTSEAEISE